MNRLARQRSGAVQALGYARKRVARVSANSGNDPSCMSQMRSRAKPRSRELAVTLSDDEALTLSLLDQVKGQAVSESAIKNALHSDAIKATDRRAKFVGIEAYEAEGGTVTRDLFSDEVFLASPALLDRLFTEKLDRSPGRSGRNPRLGMGRDSTRGLAQLL